MNGPEDGLAIGELARRTDVPAATLRSWEGRYGFPRPQRRPGGHRRYDVRDIALIEDVLRLRASGMSLPAAISQAMSRPVAAEPSVFAGLRRLHPDLAPQDFRKATLQALTWAIEDECCARAEHAAIFASFQRQRFYLQSQERWTELARTARFVVAFADFNAPAKVIAGSPLQVAVPADAPLRREWILVCAAADYPACVTGWEYPGQNTAADADRRFEVLWTVDPQVVRDAATICVRLAESFSPGLGRLLSDPLLSDPLLSDPLPPASADLRRAMSLLNRMTSYIERTTARGLPAGGKTATGQTSGSPS